MAKPLLNPDDKPVLNTFDLPAICDGADDPDRECCDPCTDWIFCLKRSLYELTLAGFDLENWLAGHWLSSLVQYKASQAALKFTDGDAGETFVFDGVYIAEPPLQGAQASPCPLPEREDDCTHTHRIRAERTLSTSSLEGDEAKRFGLNVNTECVIIEDVKYLKFTVNLVWQGVKDNAVYEPAIDSDPQVPPVSCTEFCPPKEETPYEPLLGSDWFCCPILVSDLIPVASITSLADLAEVTLNPLPPASATWDSFYGVYQYDTGDNQLCLQTSNVWTACIGVPLIDCLDGHTCCLYFTINDCPTTIDGDTPAGDPGEIQGSTAIVYAGGCGAVGGPTCQPAYCISKPVEYVEGGTYKLKVIDGKCRLPENCGSCVPDEENPTRRRAIKYGDVKFTYTPGASCSKTFTPIAPACLNIVAVYWSWGEKSTGLDPLNHTIVNLDPENPLRRKEAISAILIDDRGCIYCWSEVVECGCCPGVSGSLSITGGGEDGCDYTLTASVTTTEDCPLAFIEYQLIGPGGSCATDFVDCDCNEIDPANPGDYCTPCSGTLVNGGTASVSVSGVGWQLRYRVWDGVCGCASEWVYMPLYCAICECCGGTIVMIRVTIGGITGADPEVACPDCEALNRPYDLEPSAGGVNDCIWSVVGPDGLKCPPDSPFSFGSDVFYTIGCGEFGLGSPLIPDLMGTVAFTGGGSASLEKQIADTGFPAANCEALSGAHTLTSNTNGQCNLDDITASVEIVVAA